MNKKLLFAHGWATDFSVWNSYLDTLPNDYDIYNQNLPGHGRGNTAAWDTSTLTPGVRAISAMLADIAPKDPPIGIGWSLGALTLMKTEITRPGSFKALILIGATPSFVSSTGFPWGTEKALVRRMRADLKNDPQAAFERFYRLNFTDAEFQGKEAKGFLEKYASMEEDLDVISLANALDTLYKINIADEIGKLKLPVLIIHGSMDSVTPEEAANYLNENISDSRLFVFDKHLLCR